MAEVIVKSAAKVAQVFGVSANTVRKWIDNGMPHEPRKYDLAAIRKWKEERAKDNAAKAQSPKNDARQRKLDLEAEALQEDIERKRRQNEMLRGQYVAKYLVEEFVSRLNQYIRNELMRLPIEIQAAFPAEHRVQIVEELTGKIEMFLEGCYTWERRAMELEVSDKVGGPGRPKGS